MKYIKLTLDYKYLNIRKYIRYLLKNSVYY